MKITFKSALLNFALEKGIQEGFNALQDFDLFEEDQQMSKKEVRNVLFGEEKYVHAKDFQKVLFSTPSLPELERKAFFVGFYIGFTFKKGNQLFVMAQPTEDDFYEEWDASGEKENEIAKIFVYPEEEVLETELFTLTFN